MAIGGEFNTDRRSEHREQLDQTIRWKRPGVIEDRKGWVVDRSPSGLGFLADARTAPRRGETLHIRRWDGDRWATLDRPVRVARAAPAPGNDLVTVGCRLD